MGRGGHHTLAKAALLIIAVTCLISASYSGATTLPHNDADRAAEPLGGTTWKLTQFCADNGSIIAPLPGTEPLIAFSEDGTLSGLAGGNPYSASYRSMVPPSRWNQATSHWPTAIAQDFARQESRYHDLRCDLLTVEGRQHDPLRSVGRNHSCSRG